MTKAMQNTYAAGIFCFSMEIGISATLSMTTHTLSLGHRNEVDMDGPEMLVMGVTGVRRWKLARDPVDMASQSYGKATCP